MALGFDGCEDVAADGGASLEEVAGVGFDVEVGAVGGEAGVGLCGDVGHEGAAGRGGSREKDLGAELVHEMEKAGGVGLDEEVLEFGGLHEDDAVSAAMDEFEKVGFGDAVAEDEGGEVGATGVGELSGAGEKLVADALDAAGAPAPGVARCLLGEDPDAVM